MLRTFHGIYLLSKSWTAAGVPVYPHGLSLIKGVTLYLRAGHKGRSIVPYHQYSTSWWSFSHAVQFQRDHPGSGTCCRGTVSNARLPPHPSRFDTGDTPGWEKSSFEPRRVERRALGEPDVPPHRLEPLRGEHRAPAEHEAAPHRLEPRHVERRALAEPNVPSRRLELQRGERCPLPEREAAPPLPCQPQLLLPRVQVREERGEKGVLVSRLVLGIPGGLPVRLVEPV